MYTKGVNAVALFTRAWIEIADKLTRGRERRKSPSSRGRGLKLFVLDPSLLVDLSPSSRGRGLKLLVFVLMLKNATSPSSRGRGLKSIACCIAMFWQSRPLHEGVD